VRSPVRVPRPVGGLGIPLVPLVRRQAEKVAPVSYTNLKRLLEQGR
jgi:hypothetical protein